MTDVGAADWSYLVEYDLAIWVTKASVSVVHCAALEVG